MKPIPECQALVQEFVRIKKQHERTIVRRTAKVAMGASVYRVYQVDTKADVVRVLERFPYNALRHIKSQTEFKRFYQRQLGRVVQAVRMRNKDNPKLGNGLKWGHCAKLLSLFMRDIVLHTRLYTDVEVKRLTPMLYVPFDSIVLDRLRRRCGVSNVPKKLKDIAGSKVFWHLQMQLQNAAAQAETQAIHFDDVWAEDRQADKKGLS